MVIRAFSFETKNQATVKQQLLNWSSQFSSCCFLDNHGYASNLNAQECLVGVGIQKSITILAGTNNALHALDAFIDANKGEWIFGHIGYHFKDKLHGIAAKETNDTGFVPLHFYVPEVCVQLAEGRLIITAQKAKVAEGVWKEINSKEGRPQAAGGEVRVQPRIDKDQYTAFINKLRSHIKRGDCYEINFCQEFFATDTLVDPVETFIQLARTSPNPFTCFYRQGANYLLCASPERFLLKKGERIYSQPIKGTSPRLLADPEGDQRAISYLKNSAKERSENVMIVDLVRNDLSQICEEGSVQVDELFGIYSYPQVHQMVSTISGHLLTDVSFSGILKATFPMGSMTGAPKHRVMQLIDTYEQSNRGLFSGAVGYLNPNGDFDFNVVIRSILYNANARYLNYFVGSGITWYSNPEDEYAECMMKAEAIKKVLRSAAL